MPDVRLLHSFRQVEGHVFPVTNGTGHPVFSLDTVYGG